LPPGPSLFPYTTLFRSVGFEPVEFVVPETASDKYTAKISMQSLVVELPAVMPFPWASIEEFNMAFMALDVSDDNISRIRNSLSRSEEHTSELQSRENLV